jgi:hypothetical protein
MHVMKNFSRTVATGLAVCLSALAVASAEDDPAPAPAPAPQDVPVKAPAAGGEATFSAADAEADKKAREVLAKAAERQNAGDLVEPGRLESFHVVFFKATFEAEKTNSKGETTTQTIETDEDGLVVDWKQGSIKTQLTIDDNTTTKAWHERSATAWIFDGTKVSSLLGSDRKADYDQVQFHRRVVNQLLDVAILGKMLRDKSRWRTLPDSAPYENTVALQRITTDAPGAIPLVIWVDNPAKDVYGDVSVASMPPTEDGTATLYYRFSYRDDAPRITVMGPDGKPVLDEEGKPVPSKMRFPFGVDVYEQAGDEVPRKVLSVFTKSVDINGVAEREFAQPKPQR